MSKRVISGALVPLFPIVVGIVLKLGFIDSVPAQARYKFMIDNYGRPMWIDLVVGAYILAAGVLLTVKPNISSLTKQFLLYVPAGSFIVSIVSSLVLPKFGFIGDLWSVWIPAAVGYVSIFWVGFLVTGVEAKSDALPATTVQLVPASLKSSAPQQAEPSQGGAKK
jgi:hypothetical protein